MSILRHLFQGRQLWIFAKYLCISAGFLLNLLSGWRSCYMLSLAIQTFVEAWFIAAQEKTGSVFTMFSFQRQPNLKLFNLISGKSGSAGKAATAIFLPANFLKMSQSIFHNCMVYFQLSKSWIQFKFSLSFLLAEFTSVNLIWLLLFKTLISILLNHLTDINYTPK